MSIFQALFLGIVQGLTEFLPVSSSGHLVIFQHLFGLTEPELFFDVSVHVGTLAAVIVFYRNDIRSIIVSSFQYMALLAKRETSLARIDEYPEAKFALMIIIGSVPTAFLGLLFKEAAGRIFSSLVIVGCALIATGTVLLLTRKIENRGTSDISAKNSLVIGFVQGIAIIPGVSRSGSTIATGLFLGLDRRAAARFSFLLSIPAILGAELLHLKDVAAGSFDLAIMIGMASACVTGYAALRFLVYLVNRGGLHFFSPYCFVAGVAVILYGCM